MSLCARVGPVLGTGAETDCVFVTLSVVGLRPCTHVCLSASNSRSSSRKSLREQKTADGGNRGGPTCVPCARTSFLCSYGMREFLLGPSVRVRGWVWVR